MFVFVCVRVAQTYDADGNGSIDVQEFSSLIRDAHTTGERSRVVFTNRTPKNITRLGAIQSRWSSVMLR